MSVAAESPYAQEWFRVAAEDFRRVARRLAEEDTEDAAFHLQQSLEKYLKGYLLSKGWALKRIHNLVALLDEVVRYNPKLERYRTLCQQANGYYIIERYPTLDVGEEPSPSEVRQTYAEAKMFVRSLRGGGAKGRRK